MDTSGLQLLAVENVAVAYLRGRLPEFEPTFRRLLDEEGYWELGSIQTFAELARWLFDDAPGEAAEALRRPARFHELRAFWGEPTLEWMTSFRAELLDHAD